MPRLTHIQVDRINVQTYSFQIKTGIEKGEGFPCFDIELKLFPAGKPTPSKCTAVRETTVSI